MLNRTNLTLMLAGLSAFLVAPATSFAQDDPSAAQYDPPIPQGTASGGGSGSGSGAEASGLDAPLGSLPFTGMDLLILLAVACLLVGTGLALRKLSSPSDPSV